MTTPQTQSTPATGYDNNGQYSRTGILRYEKIFGAGYVSTGGHETTEYLCRKLDGALRPGARVLDIGSGIGGAAFHLARTYGASVTGLDLSPEMTQIALDRAEGTAAAPGNVRFVLGDILQTPLDAPFDVAWSRDALMHIPDKPRLFARIYELLADGGQVVITDYARGPEPGSTEFEDYIRSTGYHVVDPATYGRFLEGAGFVDVQVEDATDRFVDILTRETERLETDRDSFLSAFSESDLNYLLDRWEMKRRFCRAGDMKWGIYRATRRG